MLINESAAFTRGEGEDPQSPQGCGDMREGKYPHPPSADLHTGASLIDFQCFNFTKYYWTEKLLRGGGDS